MNNVDSINRQILELNHRKRKLEIEIDGIESTIKFLRQQKELLEGAKGTTKDFYDDLLSD
jgi:predicted  nucleic acid-binding Zn-ribbon protein|tara:strand:- start:995 stop:1174 length:180 start_codon:yes stop_codon:yes gene_type:complete